MELARTYATLAELSVALGDLADASRWRDALATVALTQSARDSIDEELGRADRLEEWLVGS